MADPWERFQQAEGPWMKFAPIERPLDERARRAIGITAQGLTDAAADVIGGPVDLINIPLKAVGMGSKEPIGGSQSIRNVFDYTATLPGRVSDAVSQGSFAPFSESRTSRGTPETALEKILYGGAKGAGQAVGMLTGAGLVGQAATPGSTVARLAEVLSQAPATQIVASGAGGAVEQLTNSPLAGMGTAVAVGAVPTLARALVPNVSRLTPENARLLAKGTAEGIPTTTGQATGNPAIQTAESVMRNLPLSGGMMRARDTNQQQQFARAVLEKAGISGTAADPATLGMGQQALRSVRQRIIDPATVNLDPQFQTNVQTGIAPYVGMIDPMKRPVVENFANALANRQTMPGTEYQAARTMLGGMVENLRKTDYPQMKAIKAIRNALDDAFERSVAPADAAIIRENNRQYANLKTIMSAMENQEAARAGGAIPPGPLVNAVRAANKGNFATGAGDLNDLARFGQAFVRDPIANSGTPQRQFWQNALTGSSFLGAGYAAGLPVSAAATMTIPPAAAAILQSQGVRNALTGATPQINQSEAAKLLARVLADRLPSVTSPTSIQGYPMIEVTR